jgi:hypothetical protein
MIHCPNLSTLRRRCLTMFLPHCPDQIHLACPTCSPLAAILLSDGSSDLRTLLDTLPYTSCISGKRHKAIPPSFGGANDRCSSSRLGSSPFTQFVCSFFVQYPRKEPFRQRRGSARIFRTFVRCSAVGRLPLNSRFYFAKLRCRRLARLPRGFISCRSHGHRCHRPARASGSRDTV